ncbi:hypothetical protein PoB_001677100 [Plakobranchus ocellatus]|uniref:Uncharacterized protein n=1 Tax=Plakobranchus ocellatus TaxID=259542 RepID=A0AAV3Z6N0_9GAST|nr:hypothetical protein PoB_001677100 [Plakobranchus ocellatus]
MSELDLYAKYLYLGVKLGRSGEDLTTWVEDKVRQDMERSDRQIERERKREEMEMQKKREETEMQREEREMQRQREEMAFRREEKERESQRQLELSRMELEAETTKLELSSRSNADVGRAILSVHPGGPVLSGLFRDSPPGVRRGLCGLQGYPTQYLPSLVLTRAKNPDISTEMQWF